jgi:CubicO group peptidase (beta-lactamase class C family)
MLGSISKHMLAVAVLRLVEERHVHLDQEITAYLSYLPKSWSPITIRHLLTHTSGLARDGQGYDPYRQTSVEAVIRTSMDNSLVSQPGEKWRYSNLGYFVLADVIMTTTRQEIGDFFAGRFFRPLDMRATGTTDNFRIIKNRASSYFSFDGNFLNAGGLIGFRPSGAFVSTVVDMIKWDSALQNGLILSDESQRQMVSPVQLSDGCTYPYGFGWEVGSIEGRDLVHHGGALWCFRGEYVRCLNDEVSIIVLANHKDCDVRTIARTIVGMYVPELRDKLQYSQADKKAFDGPGSTPGSGYLSPDTLRQ